MSQVIGVRFKRVGKIYYFNPDEMELEIGEKVIVETSKGLECGEVVIKNKDINTKDFKHTIKKIIRKATEDDVKKANNNKELEKRAFEICKKKISDYKLDMNLVDVEYAFDNSKILFYFTANERVDFRSLVKNLASIFKTRIELRQIGVRDESKVLGGLGICGRPFCCNTFLGEFQPVSIKMAKEQSLSLNPIKISGTCGRLMCCLKYEQNAYEYLLKITPKVGAIVKTPEGEGCVLDSNLLTGNIKVKLDSAPEAAPKSFNISEVKTIKDSKIKLNKSEIQKLKGLEDD